MLNGAYFVGGIGMMGLAWAKHRLHGYTTPTDFAASDKDKSAVHAARIVGEWTENLERYCGKSWQGRDVLELGPGGTLGTGVNILIAGASSYQAVDKFALAENFDRSFYEALLAGFGRRDEILTAIEAGDKWPLQYHVDPEFHIDRAVAQQQFDLIVSCAAFEHFDDVSDTIARLSKLARPGTIACIQIDFCTHSRWLRDHDPNNIYRYPDWLYWMLPFPGKPNRVRPDEYSTLFIKEGWEKLEFYPMKTTAADYQKRTGHRLTKQYRRPECKMDVLSGALMATKAGSDPPVESMRT